MTILSHGMRLAAAAAMLGVNKSLDPLETRQHRIVPPAPFTPDYPRGSKRYRRRWNNDGVRARKEHRLKGIRP